LVLLLISFRLLQGGHIVKSLLPAPINPEDLKAAPRQEHSMVMAQSIKIVLWTCALPFLAIGMMLALIPFVLLAGNPFIDRTTVQ
jgi:hypothetical protein